MRPVRFRNILPRTPRAMTALALCIVAHAAAAQSPGERTMLSAWDDSLQRAASVVAISAYDGPSHRGSGRAGDMRRALYLVRRGDLIGSRGDIEIALTNMQVIANHSRWAWPRFVMARAFEVMARKQWVETLSDGKQLAEKHTDALWRTLRAALDCDSTLAPARRMLAALTAAQGDRFLHPHQLAALEREARLPDAYPDALLAWGRHLRTVREYPAALTAFALAIARGGDRGRIDLEMARTIMAIGNAREAVATYWAGVEQVTPVAREMYRFDLSWITDSSNLAQFDRLPDTAVSSWLRRFWNARDAEAANYSGDRLVDHLRRWAVVLEKYRALSPWKDTFFSRVEMGFEYSPGESILPEAFNPISGKKAACNAMDATMFEQLWRMQPSHDGDLRTREPLLDHRGLIYLRHGEPQRRIDGAGASGGGLLGGPIVRQAHLIPGASPQARGPRGLVLPWSAVRLGQAPDRPNGPTGESWIYGLDGAWHVLQFRGSVALGTYAATTLTQRTPTEWLNDPRIEATIPGMNYVRLTERINENQNSAMRKIDVPSCFNEAVVIANQTRLDEHFFLDRDTDTPPGLQPSNSVFQAFALGVADDHTGKALLAFAVAAEILRSGADGANAALYPLQFHVVAYDKSADRIIQIDTLRTFATSGRLEPGHFLTAALELPLPAGTWHIAVRAQQPGGAVALNESRSIRIDNTSAVTLSDIVTGRSGNPAWTATDNAPFPVNYPNGWYRGESAELFFEVRGVPENESYQTTVEIRPVPSKSAAVIRIRSTDRTTGPVTRVRKSLGLEQLPPGRYALTVTVEAGGKEASRSREILIIPRP